MSGEQQRPGAGRGTPDPPYVDAVIAAARAMVKRYEHPIWGGGVEHDSQEHQDLAVALIHLDTLGQRTNSATPDVAKDPNAFNVMPEPVVHTSGCLPPVDPAAWEASEHKAKLDAKVAEVMARGAERLTEAMRGSTSATPRCTCDDFCEGPCPAHPNPDDPYRNDRPSEATPRRCCETPAPEAKDYGVGGRYGIWWCVCCATCGFTSESATTREGAWARWHSPDYPTAHDRRAAELEATIGEEPCGECGFSPNEIRDAVQGLRSVAAALEARDALESGARRATASTAQYEQWQRDAMWDQDLAAFARAALPKRSDG